MKLVRLFLLGPGMGIDAAAIKRLEAVETVATSHVAECAVRNKHQTQINADHEQRLRDLEKVRWVQAGVIGAAALIGSSVLAPFIQSLLGQ